MGRPDDSIRVFVWFAMAVFHEVVEVNVSDRDAEVAEDVEGLSAVMYFVEGQLGE